MTVAQFPQVLPATVTFPITITFYIPKSFGAQPVATAYSICSDTFFGGGPGPPLDEPNVFGGQCGANIYGYRPTNLFSPKHSECLPITIEDADTQNWYGTGTRSYRVFGVLPSDRELEGDRDKLFGVCGCLDDDWCPNNGVCTSLKRGRLSHYVNNIYTASTNTIINLTTCHSDTTASSTVPPLFGPPGEGERWSDSSSGGCNPGHVFGSDLTSMRACMCDNDFEHWTTSEHLIGHRDNSVYGDPTPSFIANTVQNLETSDDFVPLVQEPMIVVPCARERAVDVTCQGGGERAYLWDSQGIVVDATSILHSGVTYSTRKALGHEILTGPRVFGIFNTRSPTPMQQAMKHLEDSGVDPYRHFFSSNYASLSRNPLTDMWQDAQFTSWNRCMCGHPDFPGRFGQLCELIIWDFCPFSFGVLPPPAQPFDPTLLCGANGFCSQNGEWIGGFSSTINSIGNPFCNVDPILGAGMYLPECLCFDGYHGVGCDMTCNPACTNVGYCTTCDTPCININTTETPLLQCQCENGWADSTAVNGLLDDITDPGVLCDTCRLETGFGIPDCGGHGTCPLENINTATPTNRLACECDAGWNGRGCTVPDSLSLTCGSTLIKFGGPATVGVPVECTFLEVVEGIGGQDVQVLYDCSVALPSISTYLEPQDLYSLDASCAGINLRDTTDINSVEIFSDNNLLCQAIHDQCVVNRGGVDFCPLPFLYVDNITPNAPEDWFCDRPVVGQLFQAEFYPDFVPCWLKETDLSTYTYQCVSRPSSPHQIIDCEIVLTKELHAFFSNKPPLFSQHVRQVCLG